MDALHDNDDGRLAKVVDAVLERLSKPAHRLRADRIGLAVTDVVQVVREVAVATIARGLATHRQGQHPAHVGVLEELLAALFFRQADPERIAIPVRLQHGPRIEVVSDRQSKCVGRANERQVRVFCPAPEREQNANKPRFHRTGRDRDEKFRYLTTIHRLKVFAHGLNGPPVHERPRRFQHMPRLLRELQKATLCKFYPKRL